MNNLNDILIKLKKEDFNNYQELYDLINNYNNIDYKEYMEFNELNYKKNYLYTCEKFDLVLICWDKYQNTQIHDHPDYCCILKVLEGALMEEEFINTDGNIKLYDTKILKEGSITNKIKNKIVHRIIPLEKSVSLHLYVPGLYKPNYLHEKN